MRNNFDITTIEDGMVTVVKSCGFTSVFKNRPKSTTRVNDFVVVGISGSVEDMGTHGIANIGIDLFAKDVENFKNDKKLRYMYNQLIKNLPMSFQVTNTITPATEDESAETQSLEVLIDSKPNILGDTYDDYGFTARMIEFRLIIKLL